MVISISIYLRCVAPNIVNAWSRSEGSSPAKVPATQPSQPFLSPPVSFRKHSFSEGRIPLSEDGTIPEPKKTQAGLSPLPGKPSSSKDSEDTSKEPGLSTQMSPVMKYSGQTSGLSASPASQSTGDSLLAAVSP